MKDFKELTTHMGDYHVTWGLNRDGEISFVEVEVRATNPETNGYYPCLLRFSEFVFEEEEVIARLDLFVNRIKNRVKENAWTIEFIPLRKRFIRWGDSKYSGGIGGVIDKKSGIQFTFLEPVPEKEVIEVCERFLEVLRRDDTTEEWRCSQCECRIEDDEEYDEGWDDEIELYDEECDDIVS